MNLLLIRHGLAGKPDANAWPDDELRPLTPKGRKTFKHAAKGLRSLGVAPARILASPATRTLETAGILSKACRLPASALHVLSELHHSRSPSMALSALAKKRLPRSLALVGHEPWLGEFLSLLIAGDTRAGLEFAKGGAALVSLDGFAPRAGRLEWLLTQDQLAALA